MGTRPAPNPSSANLSVPEGREGSKGRKHPCRRGGVFEPRQDDRYEGGQASQDEDDSSRPMFSDARDLLLSPGGLRIQFPQRSKHSSGLLRGRDVESVAKGSRLLGRDAGGGQPGLCAGGYANRRGLQGLAKLGRPLCRRWRAINGHCCGSITAAGGCTL